MRFHKLITFSVFDKEVHLQKAAWSSKVYLSEKHLKGQLILAVRFWKILIRESFDSFK